VISPLSLNPYSVSTESRQRMGSMDIARTHKIDCGEPKKCVSALKRDGQRSGHIPLSLFQTRRVPASQHSANRLHVKR
jgi:hypothetical protein